MFTPVENFKAYSESRELRSYCSHFVGMCSDSTNDLVHLCGRVLIDLYGRSGVIDRYDGVTRSGSLGLGNIQELVSRITRYALSKMKNRNEIKLPLAATQLNEAASDLVNLLISSNDSYTAFGNPNNQKYVAAVAERMSQDFTRFDHFNVLLQAFKCILHYGIAAVEARWDKDSINQFNVEGVTENPAFGVNLKLINPGCLYFSKLTDMRSFSECGDFCAYVESIAKTDILNQALHPEVGDKELSELLECSRTAGYRAVFSMNNPRDFKYILDFNPLPNDTERDSDITRENFINKTTVYVRVCPELLGFELPGLEPLTKTLLKLTYIGQTLVNAEVSSNGVIPLVVAPVFPGVAPAENLTPVQCFINFLINTKQKGDRKKVYGLNFYDRNRISLNEITKAKEADEECPWIPVSSEPNESLGSAIMHFNDAPDTQHILSDINQMKNIMQIIMPTDQASLMSSLDRATEWQAKKALETSGKATKLMARQIQAMLITPLKSIHIQTIFDHEATLMVKDDQGNDVPTAVGEFSGRGVMYSITTAMTGVDRDIKAQQMDTFINKLIQLPQVAQEYDLTKLFDYQSSLTGHQIDFSMFKKESPIDSLSIQQRNLAYQLLQQAMAQQQQQQEIPVDQNSQNI